MALLAGIVAVLAVLLGLLAIPLTLTFRLSWPQPVRREVTVEWAFGLVRVRPEPDAGDTPSHEDVPSGKGRRGRARSSTRSTDILAALRDAPFRRRLVRFAGDVWSSIGKRDVFLRLRLGLGDPADTGQLWAVLGPLAGLLATVRDASIRIQPDFVDDVVDIDTGGQVRIVPLRLIALAVMLAVSPDFRRGLRRMRRSIRAPTVRTAGARR